MGEVICSRVKCHPATLVFLVFVFVFPFHLLVRGWGKILPYVCHILIVLIIATAVLVVFASKCTTTSASTTASLAFLILTLILIFLLSFSCFFLFLIVNSQKGFDFEALVIYVRGGAKIAFWSFFVIWFGLRTAKLVDKAGLCQGGNLRGGCGVRFQDIHFLVQCNS